MTGRRRLLLENVEARAGELAGHQRVVQRRLVDNPAACGVDQISRRLHALQPRRIEHSDRLGCLRAMNADKIGARQGCIEIADLLAACRLDLGGRLVGIIDQHGHFHGKAAFGSPRANAAKADDQDRLAVQIVGQFTQPVAPIAVLDDGMHFDRALGEHQHHEHRLFRHRRGIGGTRHHQRDLAAAQSRNIDRVVTDADPGHHLHVL